MAETQKRSDELKVRIDPRLIARVEEYAEQHGTGVDYAVTDLLEAGLGKLSPRAVGAKLQPYGKRKAREVAA